MRILKFEFPLDFHSTNPPIFHSCTFRLWLTTLLSVLLDSRWMPIAVVNEEMRKSLAEI
jgi:hypothetical protein